ncbi:MAG: ATP-dependent DNA helicase RecG [Planctomycetota bacterium]
MIDKEATSEISLNSPLSDLPGLTPTRARLFSRLKMHRVRDVVFFFPRSYEIPAPLMDVDQIREGEPASLVGEVTEIESTSRTPGKSITGILVENESGAVRLVFFNQAYRATQYPRGSRVMVSGTPKLSGFRMEFVHPKVTVLEEEDIAQAQILPIYSLSEGIKQWDLRGPIAETVELMADRLTEALPSSIRTQALVELEDNMRDDQTALPDIATAIRHIHNPPDEASLAAARSRFVFQELLVMQLAMALRRRSLTVDLQAPPIESTAMIDARIVNRFPFSLTGDQRLVIDEIRRDMACQFPMNRMLQADVGAGKTVVAIYAMLSTVAGGHQAVLMAPTEVLARQHHRTLTRMMDGSQVRIGLLTGSISRRERAELIVAVASGDIDMLIGTQALIYGEIEFKSLGLCVIDEQHKFGVNQRVKLRSGGIDPHVLVMSATPIPRSVALTMFGDVELSTMREKPPGRAGVKTYLGRDEWRNRWWGFVRERLDEGRQAFVVAPRVTSVESDEESKESVASVEATYEELAKDQLRDYQVELLHGRMPPEEKESVMRRFANGDFHVLVSTTVIEVGIDIPNATVMTILGAQRFGLAQLHQLRGRIARGTHAGHLCLFTDGGAAPEEYERLQVMEQSDDGFELAEADFRMRGAGDLLGQRQSGMPPMMVADLQRDEAWLLSARRVAQAVVEDDPTLGSPELDELGKQVRRRYAKRLELGDAV